VQAELGHAQKRGDPAGRKTHGDQAEQRDAEDEVDLAPLWGP
jgi:hypothetical protein